MSLRSCGLRSAPCPPQPSQHLAKLIEARVVNMHHAARTTVIDAYPQAERIADALLHLVARMSEAICGAFSRRQTGPACRFAHAGYDSAPARLQLPDPRAA